jgi:CheY-like chemotaxis protein
MARYYSDLDDGKAVFVDSFGSELADEKMVPDEAIGFLTSFLKDQSPSSDRIFVVSTRNDEGEIVFRTTLILQSEWIHSHQGTPAHAIERPVVLIVEDDAVARFNAVEIVGDAGYDAVEAESADEAISILEARSDVLVVFTDIRLPGSMDGLKLARYIKHQWPPIAIIATSGQFMIRQDELPDGGVFLPKPYSPASVTSVLRTMTFGAACRTST